MNTSDPTAAFDVQFRAENNSSGLIIAMPNLSNAPRLPVDLTLLAMQVRQKLGWTTTSLQAALEEGIGEGTQNPVHANLVAQQGKIHAKVSGDGTTGLLGVEFNDMDEQVECVLEPEEMRSFFEASQPFMPSMADPLWTPPGLNDPHMKVDRDPFAVSPENGWPAGFAMPWTYERMGQEVNGDLSDCLWLPEDAESLFLEFIQAALVTRVSIMGVFSAFDANGNGHASLAISESDMELMIMPEIKKALATFFTCGNSNPRPSIDVLHKHFNAAVTEVFALVRGRDVPFGYQGMLVRGGTGNTVWKDKRIRLHDQLLLGEAI